MMSNIAVLLTSVDPAVLFSRVTQHLVNYLKGFVNTNYSELVKFKEELILFEEACRCMLKN
jgi:hypothetical protein